MEAVEIQVLSVVLFTKMLCDPAAIPANVTEDWYAPASILYSYPVVGAVTTMVPVAKAQVGCIVVVAVAATGAVGWAFTITGAGLEMHVLSEVLLTKMVCDPAPIPANVTEA